MILFATLLALSAGALFGFNIHVQRHAVDGTGPFTGAFLSVGTMTVLLWLLSPFFVDWAWFGLPALWLFVLGGVFFPAAGQSFQIFAIRAVGPALTSAIGAFAPFFAVVPALLFLGEPFSAQLALGMGLMTVGLVYAAVGSRKIARTWPLWALLLPLGAALARGLVQPVTRAGLEQGPSAFFATLVLGSISSLVLLGILILRHPRDLAALFRPSPGMRWFAVSGVINGAGILCLNTAIGLGGVTLAAPLAATAPLWSLGFGAFVFKREALRPMHYTVAALVVLGVVLVVTRAH